ncbi:hypothetical protein DM02DRAFT_313408 [Periconia macrospinosa]|uniref:Zn(2)-C6 fungal-type domain-containing protein n=1 Tax=Periconia macrospinosa TaxID=97972 RepID=A0A2V1DZ75_9PLEO|nr:hypothetical protein DM02DRAFT_313408 [Periconia macrospinosa]
MANNAPQSRPYRSHRVPACIRCRSRKIRCVIDIPGEPCNACRTANQPGQERLQCQYIDSSSSSKPESSGSRLSGKRRRTSNYHDDGNSEEGMPARPSSAPLLHKPSSHPSASIILAPHVAEDVDIVQRHISQDAKATNSTNASVGNSGPDSTLTSGSAPATQPYSTVFRDVSNPIVYLTVPRFRRGLAPELGAGREQLEIISQIIGPFKRDIIDLYLHHLHYNFPVVDEETCRRLLEKDGNQSLSNTLLCNVYAQGLAHWSFSPTLRMHPKPSMHYIYTKAISAVLEDFLSPSMATVASALLDQIGRPSVSIVGNLTLCGRTVALAQTFGLHRDPSKWNITSSEKASRIRIWWGVLITDHWSSISHGLPPQISKRFYDVPRPTLATLLPSTSMTGKFGPTDAQKHATTNFIHLCALTELLGEILPLVYEVQPVASDFDSIAHASTSDHAIQNSKARLDVLERQLPPWQPQARKPGLSNLWFCFLSMRLLVSRVTLRAAVVGGDVARKKAGLGELHGAAKGVLEFVLKLGQSEFTDFWFPYVTHLLVQALTVSLRCTLETEPLEARQASISMLQRVLDHIRHARDNFDWDVADYCIERCSDSVSKVAAILYHSTTAPSHSQQLRETPNSRSHPQIPPDPHPNFNTPTNATSTDIPASNNVTAAAMADGDNASVLQHQQEDYNIDPFPITDLLDPNGNVLFDFDLDMSLSWEALWDAPSGVGMGT